MPFDPTTSFVGVLTKAAASLVGAVARALKAPRFQATADAADPFIKNTTLSLVGVSPIDLVTKGAVDYYRIKIHNQGKTAAKGCKVQLIGVLYVDHGAWAEIAGWEPVTLRWSLKGTATTDLAPEEEAYADLGRVFSNYVQSNYVIPMGKPFGQSPTGFPGRFHLEPESQPNSQYGSFAHGQYVFKLKVFSNDAKTTPASVYVDFVGEFATIGRTSPAGTKFCVEKKPTESRTMFKARHSC